MEIGEEGEDLFSAKAEGGGSGGQWTDGSDVEFGHDGGEKSVRELIQFHLLRSRHFLRSDRI
jgi:hypothetical protein